MLILQVNVCHTFHIFLLEFDRLPELSRTSSPVKDFPVLELAIVNSWTFQVFLDWYEPCMNGIEQCVIE